MERIFIQLRARYYSEREISLKNLQISYFTLEGSTLLLT